MIKVIIIYELHGLNDVALDTIKRFAKFLGERLDVDRAMRLLAIPDCRGHDILWNLNKRIEAYEKSTSWRITAKLDDVGAVGLGAIDHDAVLAARRSHAHLRRSFDQSSSASPFTAGAWPLFGPSKTIRGVVASLLVTTFGAPVIGLEFGIGLLVATTAMAGDLLSSFVKRRLGLAPSSRATGLDQVPESLFPLLACRSALSLTAIDIVGGCVLFFVGELLLSQLFFWLRLRDRPY